MSKTKVYSRDEIEVLHASIPHGKKKKIASMLGIKSAALSRYINPRNHAYRMPETVYAKILDIINNQLLSEHGK